MAEITASLVKDLREKTGAGMMDCKKALTESAGDFEEAITWLRKKGLSAAAKKSSRAAAEGLVGITIAADRKSAAMVEVNSETDFVARNDKFQDLVRNIVKVCLDKNCSEEELKSASYPNTGRTVEDEVKEHVAVIGENMNLRRSINYAVTKGVVATYMHNEIQPNLGKIGIMVAIESEANQDKLATLGKQIAMHIAASRPESVTTDTLDKALIEKERAFFSDQARASGKPESIIEKMVEGRIRKFYEEVVLLEQPFVMDNKVTVAEVVANLEKELGTPIKITKFVRFTLGEGVEKQETDFAAEVASLTK